MKGALIEQAAPFNVLFFFPTASPSSLITAVLLAVCHVELNHLLITTRRKQEGLSTDKE